MAVLCHVTVYLESFAIHTTPHHTLMGPRSKGFSFTPSLIEVEVRSLIPHRHVCTGEFGFPGWSHLKEQLLHFSFSTSFTPFQWWKWEETSVYVCVCVHACECVCMCCTALQASFILAQLLCRTVPFSVFPWCWLTEAGIAPEKGGRQWRGAWSCGRLSWGSIVRQTLHWSGITLLKLLICNLYLSDSCIMFFK